MLPRRRASLSLGVFLLSLVVLATAQAQGPAGDSPFLPPANAATAPKTSAAAGYEFIGMTEVGKDILLIINRQSDKHSLWVAVGKSVGDLTVVSYDPASESAVIRADNQTLTLTLRKGNVVAGPAVQPFAAPTPAPAFAPASPSAVPALSPVVVPTKPMTLQEEKETEARMLVTDLLEIGQQQRKAYEEAQRQAAKRAADPKMPRADAAAPTKR